MPPQSEGQESAVKSKRPSDSAFKQQRLPAWQPMLTAGTVLPTFFIIGIAFIPIGAALLFFSNEVREHIIDYTFCNKTGTDQTCASIIEANPLENCTCQIDFELERDMVGSVYMYYGLSNYYQNHRRYVKSRDDDQLLGRLKNPPSTDCAPFDKNDEGLPIAPCGAIANSLFNDTLKIRIKDTGRMVPLLRDKIAWPSDKDVKFRNPHTPGKTLEQELQGFVRPKAWSRELWQLDIEDSNNGFQNEDLIVWMRTAALPTFRKLYRRVDHSEDPFSQGLQSGNYTLMIQYSYPVTAFDGSKKMILSTTSILGGKNPFLGIAYVVVGCICLLLGVILLLIHVKFSKSPNEMINVNQRTPYT